VHFNKDKPENHNLLLTNLRSNIIKVLNDNNKWEATDLQEVIDYLIDKSTDIINNKYNEIKQNINYNKYETEPDKCFK
jgi:predicted nucleic-acid-binding protein